MFRRLTIEVTGGEAKGLVVLLMRAATEAVRMILEGETGTSTIGALQREQCEIKLDEFDPCCPPSSAKCDMNSLQVIEGPRLYD